MDTLLKIFGRMRDEILGRARGAAAVWRGRREFNAVARRHGLSFPLHHVDLALLVLLLGEGPAHRLHEAMSGHHLHDGDIRDKIEAAIEWETEAVEGRDAYDVWKERCPYVDMLPALERIGLSRGEEPDGLIMFDNEGRWTSSIML